MTIKVLITDGLASEGLKLLESSGLFAVDFHKAVEKAALPPLLADAEVLIVRSATKVTADVLANAPKLRVIMRAGAGVDNIDMPAASAKGVLVFNTPGVNNQAVAELTLGMMFALLREIPKADASMKQDKWDKKDLVGSEAKGRTLGLLGFGAIGSIVGNCAHALGMKVIAYDPKHGDLKGKHPHVEWCNSIDDVFARGDMVSLHLPLLPTTKNSIGAAQFNKMKKGSYFINASRGGIAREDDLLAALEAGHIAGAALDVFEQEPVPAAHKLAHHPRVVCTPHIGAATKESQTKVGIAAADGLIGFYRTKNTSTAVNAGEVKF
jgi:D-3-phosphoglycerate dehydrogenase / 2-oxoglutarate reductase